MAKTDSAKVMWKVQTRLHYGRKWTTKSTFERRKDARERASEMRGPHWMGPEGLTIRTGYGFGNTRIVKYIRGEKK